MRTLLSTIVLLFLFFVQGSAQMESDKERKIKLKKNLDSSLVHFQSEEYIISFNLTDLQKIYRELDIPFEIETNDTLSFLGLIKSIDSTGKGNWTNNFRLNIKFRELIERGKVRIYDTTENQFLKVVHKEVDNVPGAGVIYQYKDRKKKVIVFAEAFIGTPAF